MNPAAIRVPEDQFLQEGDTVIIRSNGNGQLVGRPLFASNLRRRTTFSGFCIRFRPTSALIDPRFAYYFIRSPICRERFVAHGTGTGIQNLNQATITSIDIELPAIPEQRAIAGILGTLDDKIELNRRMNQTLEALARAIFKSWFVDFDPVVAKAAGRQPAGMNAATARLFPAEFEDSPLGPIPKGWCAAPIGERFALTMGQSPPGKTYNEVADGLPFFQGRTDFGLRFPTRRVYCTAPTRFAERGDTLVSVRAPVGDINMAWERCAVGRGLAAVRHKSGAKGFTYHSMHFLRENFDNFEGDGTLFGCIGRTDFHEMKHAAPPLDVVDEYERHVSPFEERLRLNEQQSRTLAALRDALLPRLLSGEMCVKIAAQPVAEAVK